MNADKYIPIMCHNYAERAEIIKKLNDVNIQTTRVGKSEERLLAYFSKDSELVFIRKLLTKYGLIDEEPYFLSPKQQRMIR